MGFREPEVSFIELKEFDLLLTGYHRRQDRETNRTRHILSFILSYSGMGASEYVSPELLWPLAIDEEGKKQMITTLSQAKKLYKEFVN